MEFLTNRTWLLVIVTFCVILPPSLMRKITALRYTSMVAISGIIYITIVMLIRALGTDAGASRNWFRRSVPTNLS